MITEVSDVVHVTYSVPPSMYVEALQTTIQENRCIIEKEDISQPSLV